MDRDSHPNGSGGMRLPRNFGVAGYTFATSGRRLRLQEGDDGEYPPVGINGDRQP
jgi:hypothetical protein